MHPSFVICAPNYSDASGGSLFLHRLAARLQETGHAVALAPMPPVFRRGRREMLREWFFPRAFRTAPGTDIEVLKPGTAVGDAIVVYPEIVRGNPLGAKNVVRWLLNKPGLLFPFEPVPGEMYFKSGNFSDDLALTGGAPLLTAWQINPIYEDRGATDRTGTCYMVRKGTDREIVHDLRGSIRLDGLSHREIADVFNRTHSFYSYDEMTLYSQYAAICGCLSIVVPKYFESHDAYVESRTIARFGVSYGFDHFDHARATQHLVRDLLAEEERESDETITRFVNLTQKRFFGAP